MNRKTIQRTLYFTAVLLVAGGLLLRLLHLAPGNTDLHLILVGHLAALTAIFIHIKHITDAEREQQHAQRQTRQLNNK